MIEHAEATSFKGDCWNQIGVRGDRSCPELKLVVHCHNCPIFGAAGRRLLAAAAPAGYLEEVRAELAEAEAEPPSGEQHSVLVFRIADEWLALAVHVLVEVTPAFPVHSVPQRAGLLAGIVNIRGELQLCIRLDRLLGITMNSSLSAAKLKAGAQPRGAPLDIGHAGLQRFVVVRSGPDRWVFPVDEVDQVRRFEAGELSAAPATVARSGKAFTRGIFNWKQRPTGFLDEACLFQTLGARLAQ